MFIMVLNLIINGIPSIPLGSDGEWFRAIVVLNLIINGIPSIRDLKIYFLQPLTMF